MNELMMRKRGMFPVVPRRRSKLFGPPEVQHAFTGLSPDLWPKPVWKGGGQEPGQGAMDQYTDPSQQGFYDRNVYPYPLPGTSIFLPRGLTGTVIAVSTTPVQLVNVGQTGAYLITNPATSIGATAVVTGASGTFNVQSDTTLTSIGVSNFGQAHLMLNVTACTGTWDIYALVYDPTSLTWIRSQLVWTGITGTMSDYQMLGPMGVVGDLAFLFVPTAPGAITLTIGVGLKNGVASTLVGAASTVYLGGSGGVSTVSGYPILPGDEKVFVIGQNVELWAVALGSLSLRMFSLQ